MKKASPLKKPLLISGIVLAVILLISIIGIALQPQPHVSLETPDQTASPLSARDRTRVTDALWSILHNTLDLPEDTVTSALIREDSYQETTQTSLGTTTAHFLIDLDDLELTYAVSLDWSNSSNLLTDVYITCPAKVQMKYPENASRCQAMNGSAPSDILEPYLPYASTNFRLTLESPGELSATLYVFRRDAPDQASQKSAEQGIKDDITAWIKSKGADPSSYHLTYTTELN